MELKTKNVNLFFDFITDTIDGLVELMNNGYKIKDKKTGLFSKHNTEDTDVIEFKSLLKLNKACTIDKLEPLYTAYNSNILYSDSFDEFINIIYEYILFRRIVTNCFHYYPYIDNDKDYNDKDYRRVTFIDTMGGDASIKTYNTNYYVYINFQKQEDVSIDSQSSFLDSYINTGSIGKSYTTFVNIGIKDEYSPDKSNYEFILGDSPEINKPEEEIMVTNALAYLAQTIKNEFEYLFMYALNNYSQYVKAFIYNNIEAGYYGAESGLYRNKYKELSIYENVKVYKLLEDIINGRITICK